MALLLVAILVVSLVPVAMAAENINFGIDVTRETDKIKVNVADGNDEAFAALAQENKHFSLTVPCEFESAYVTCGGNVVESELDTEEAVICFPVIKSGEYQILKGEAPEETHPGVEDDSEAEPTPPTTGGGSGSSGGDSGSAEPESGSGSTGSSSGDNSGNGTQSTGTAAATVPVQGDHKTVWVQTSVSGTVASLESMTTNQMNAVINDKVKTGMVTVDLSRLNKTVDSVRIPANVLKQLADASNDSGNDTEGLEILLSGGTAVEFDAEALAGILAESGNRAVTVSVKACRNAGGLTAAQVATVGNRAAYDVTVSVNGRKISGIGGRIRITVPYTLKNGERAEGLAVCYVDADGNREYCETGYDSRKKQISWWTDHLSVYMIDYEEPAAAAEATTEPMETAVETQTAETVQEMVRETEESPQRANTYLLWISGFCLLLALVLLGVLICMRKKW